MSDLEKYLKVLSDGMKTLAKGFESVAERVDALAKAKGAVKPAKKAEAKKTTRTPAAKPASEKTTRPGRKAFSRKAQEPTATETVYQIISRHPNGVDLATIQQTTGFNDKKIRNITYKLKKQGKIHSPAKGLYAKS